MGPEKHRTTGDFPAAANSLLVLPKSLIRCIGNFGRNRPIWRFFPMRHKAKFPANCKNSLQIPADQGI
jgi:hypothetical protein